MRRHRDYLTMHLALAEWRSIIGYRWKCADVLIGAGQHPLCPSIGQVSEEFTAINNDKKKNNNNIEERHDVKTQATLRAPLCVCVCVCVDVCVCVCYLVDVMRND